MNQQPILSGEWADPFLLKDGEDYYLYPTKDSKGWLYEKFHVFHSKDLKNWDGPYLALDLNEVSWAKSKAWAPGVNRFRDKYYMYFTAEAQIGVAESASPLGPFRDLLGRPLIKTREYGCQSIDADLFIDENGSPYLLWGQGKCWIAALNDDMVSFKTEPVCLSDHFYEVRGRDSSVEDNGIYNEGPHLQLVDGRYLLTWSNYDTRDPRYQICFAVSDNVLGPYDAPEDNRMTRPSERFFGTGHASMAKYKDGWVLCYHRLIDPDNSVLRETCISKIEFTDGYPHVNVDQALD